MNCLEFRRAIGADPNDASAESLAHRTECATCAKYAQEMLRLNGLIKRALDVPVRPVKSVTMKGVTRSSPERTQRMRWYATAASFLFLVGVGGALWFLGYPRASLASDVVAHIAHEPQALTITASRVSAELLDGALRAKGMHLVKPMNDVSYLQSCVIRGKLVPHLVVQTDRGPVTVIILPQENIPGPERFDEQQYHGELVPMEHGSMAVIANDSSIVDTVAKKVRESIAWN